MISIISVTAGQIGHWTALAVTTPAYLGIGAAVVAGVAFFAMRRRIA